MPLTLTQKAAHIWRSFVDPLASTLVKHKPDKADLRFWGTWVEDEFARYEATGVFGVDTTDDLTSWLLYGGNIVPSAVSTVTGELTVALGHDLCTGMPVYVATTSGTFLANTIYWVYRNPAVHDKISLCSSYDNAMAGVPIVPVSGSLPTMKIHRDPTQSRVTIRSGERLDGLNGGTIIGGLTGRVTPRDFEATGVATDNSLQLQMFLHWIRTSWRGSYYSASGEGEAVPYRHTRPLQAGQIRNPGFTCSNLALFSACANQIALDLSGINTASFPGLFIEADPSAPPSVGRFSSRVMTALIGGGFADPSPPSPNSNFIGESITGEFTKAAVIELNSDLNVHVGGKYANGHLNYKATTVMVCTDPQTMADHIDGIVQSSFWPTPGSGVAAGSIGTVTASDWLSCDIRRPQKYTINLASGAINASATPIMVTFPTGSISANGITNGTLLTFSALNNAFKLEEGIYSVKGIVGDVAELWKPDGSAQVSHLTGGVDGGAVTGSMTAGRVTNAQIAPLIVGGPIERMSMNGYLLAYGLSCATLDAKQGNISGPTIRAHGESAKQYMFDVVPHPSTARVIDAVNLDVSGDLAGKAQVYIRPGGAALAMDGYINVYAAQPGTPGIVTNSGLKMFGGNVSSLSYRGFVRTTLGGMMTNIASLADFSAEVYDAETGTRTQYPLSTYRSSNAKYIVNSPNCGTLGAVAGVADRIDLAPFIPEYDITTDTFGVLVSVAVAAAQGKIVCYKSDIDGHPSTRLFETGTLDFSSTGFKTATQTQKFVKGAVYWLGVRHSSTATIRALPDGSSPVLSFAATPGVNPNKLLQRTLAFATAAPTDWVWVHTEEAAASVPAVWMSEV